MKGAIVAALVGSAVAVSHKAHAGFHLRRDGGYAVEEGVCKTVTTTVYVTASPGMSNMHKRRTSY
jgi:hypothetical protein